MKLPKMILFDYGDTLVYETGGDVDAGIRAVMAHATANPLGLSAEEISAFSTELFEEMGRSRELGLELHYHAQQRYLYEYLKIELPLSPVEMETIFWDAMSPGQATPGAAELLSYLAGRGIATGVISNIAFSGEALARRITSLYPGHAFSFIMASSEYLFRKPDPRIFALALRKAGLSPEEAWYCGDNPAFDGKGAAAAGLFPVWYRSGLPSCYRDTSQDVPPEGEHFVANGWEELVAFLESMDHAPIDR